MRYNKNYTDTFFLANKNLTEEEFLHRCGARTGYALSEFKRFYAILFSEAENVSDIYSSYYYMEFASLAEYLYNKVCMPRDVVDAFTAEIKQKPDLILWEVDQLSYGGYDNQFLFSDEYYDRFDKILLMED
jgi:hypothetical protein